ncbi:MAG: site-specific integrase [Candidatus Thiodiazotropha sp. (ex Lucinoma borealis)]|nr:site-specific integrase [Candidatus Thiodiazotropha sp. (ex Lucinoma borealis)]
MTPLRKQMIEAMQLRGFSPRTHESYLYGVEQLAQHYHCSPDNLSPIQLQDFFKYLALERKLSPASCRLYLNGVRFLFRHVLNKQSFEVSLVIPKREQRIPELLNRVEVARLLCACHYPKHRMLLETCYGCGLRVSELVALKARDIDGERQLLRIEQGKGAKDRLVLIAPTLLKRLRLYWQAQHPKEWLFPNEREPDRPLNISTAQRAFHRAKTAAGIDKIGGIHSLRHAYATHQLESGLPVHQLQRLLGHQNLRSTLRYIHWVPNDQGKNQGHADLIGNLAVDRE